MDTNSDEYDGDSYSEEHVADEYPDEHDGENYHDNSLSLVNSNPRRMSMDQYYIAQKTTLPEYEDLIQLHQPPRQELLTVQPRETEGHEVLPSYSSDLSLENVFMKKMELEGAVHRADDRNWNRVFVTLQGTALKFYKYKSSLVFGTRPEFLDDCPDLPVEAKKGECLRSYSLHLADAGIAADYTKKNHVIRIRAESDQFLLSCQRIETFVHWLQALSAAIDLALPIDERELPRDFSVPRHQRQERRFEPPAQSAADMELGESVIRAPPEPRFRSRDMPSLENLNAMALRSGSVSIVSARAELNVSVSIPRKRPTKPSISPETGKWQPEHGWSPRKDMIYAKHCMAILLSRSPRKSNIIIMNGKQWIVDWDTGSLTRSEPPDYEEIFDVSRVNSIRHHRNGHRA